MHKYWEKKSQEEIKAIVFGALEKNINYDQQHALGVPASYLDDKVFNQDATFIKDAPFISALVQNPNHIGCHTLGKSEPFFIGTQSIEQELIEICAVDILKGEPHQQDGYVASGGTEANMQAIWVYRNYFMHERSASRDEICIICSQDSHYSMDKAANVLALDIYKTEVSNATREISLDGVKKTIEQATQDGKKHFIVICNMMTTMFGSVDDVDVYVQALEEMSCDYKLHVDGAYGGFYYPFTDEESKLTFQNPNITSFTLDAHKMAQAPYGTGIFLIRKNLIQHANTQQASYVEGEDFTLIGSRSGANAVSVWMILVKNGPFGWHEKIFILQKRAEWMCKQLEQLNIQFYRHPMSNIITIRSSSISGSIELLLIVIIRSSSIDPEIALKFGLVPDNHSQPEWYKIVIMEHVIIEKLNMLISELKMSKASIKP